MCLVELPQNRPEPGQTVNADIYCSQLDRVNQSVIEEDPAIVIRIGVILQRDNAKTHCARYTCKQIITCSGWYCLSHHTSPILYHRISIYSDIFYVAKNLKIRIVFKTPSPDILAQNQ